MHDVHTDKVVKLAWRDPITDVFDLLTEFGWEVRTRPFFPLIDACRLIVNVQKHGKGRSLEELNHDYPRYLRDPLGRGLPTIIPDYLDHTLLTVSEERFARSLRRYARSGRNFPSVST